MKVTQVVSVSTALALLASAGLAQDAAKKFGMEYGISTLGLYAAPTYKLDEKSSFRAPLYLGSLSDSVTEDGNTVDGKFSANSLALMADYQPWANGMRVSGGFAFGGYNLTADWTDPELGGQTFTGTTTAEFKQENKIAPVLSLGYARQFKNGIGIVADLGVKVGKYTLTADSTFLSGAEKTDFEAEIADVNKDLADVGLIPFITLGGVFKF